MCLKGKYHPGFYLRLFKITQMYKHGQSVFIWKSKMGRIYKAGHGRRQFPREVREFLRSDESNSTKAQFPHGRVKVQLGSISSL